MAFNQFFRNQGSLFCNPLVDLSWFYVKARVINSSYWLRFWASVWRLVNFPPNTICWRCFDYRLSGISAFEYLICEDAALFKSSLSIYLYLSPPLSLSIYLSIYLLLLFAPERSIYSLSVATFVFSTSFFFFFWFISQVRIISLSIFLLSTSRTREIFDIIVFSEFRQLSGFHTVGCFDADRWLIQKNKYSWRDIRIRDIGTLECRSRGISLIA